METVIVDTEVLLQSKIWGPVVPTDKSLEIIEF